MINIIKGSWMFSWECLTSLNPVSFVNMVKPKLLSIRSISKITIKSIRRRNILFSYQLQLHSPEVLSKSFWPELGYTWLILGAKTLPCPPPCWSPGALTARSWGGTSSRTSSQPPPSQSTCPFTGWGQQLIQFVWFPQMNQKTPWTCLQIFLHIRIVQC